MLNSAKLASKNRISFTLKLKSEKITCFEKCHIRRYILLNTCGAVAGRKAAAMIMIKIKDIIMR